MSENDGFKHLDQMLEERKRKREEDVKRYEEHDRDLCMLCHAYGEDKRSLNISCFYAIEEVVPEALDMANVGREEGEPPKRNDYYLRICKSCRAALLGHLRDWRDKRIARRDIPKDHDGGDLYDDDPERNIPVRIDGATVMLTREEWDARQAQKQEQP